MARKKSTDTVFVPGSYNQICDRTGFKVKATTTQREWTGNTVRTKSWEERHDQDLLRSVQDRQDVEDPRLDRQITVETPPDDPVFIPEPMTMFLALADLPEVLQLVGGDNLELVE